MKRLAAWAAVCIGALIVQLSVTYWFLTPHIDANQYNVIWIEHARTAATGTGWLALTPYYAWPILVTYGSALLAPGIVIAVAVRRSIVLRERQAIAEREAAADAQVQTTQRMMAEAQRIRRASQNEVQAAMEQMARREQEADAQVEAAEFRLNRSVKTNIGLRRQIQKLRDRLNGQDKQATMGHC